MSHWLLLSSRLPSSVSPCQFHMQVTCLYTSDHLLSQLSCIAPFTAHLALLTVRKHPFCLLSYHLSPSLSLRTELQEGRVLACLLCCSMSSWRAAPSTQQGHICGMNEHSNTEQRAMCFLSSSISSWIQLPAALLSFLLGSKSKSFLFSERNKDEATHSSLTFTLLHFSYSEKKVFGKFLLEHRSNLLSLTSFLQPWSPSHGGGLLCPASPKRFCFFKVPSYPVFLRIFQNIEIKQRMAWVKQAKGVKRCKLPHTK